jgi:hypothetical protein
MNTESQMGLFDTWEGQREKKHACHGANCNVCGLIAKERGQTQALVNADAWTERAAKWVIKQPVGTQLTSELVTAELGLPSGSSGTNKNNAVGATMTALSKQGYIKQMGYTKSRTPRSHGAVIAVWERTALSQGAA